MATTAAFRRMELRRLLLRANDQSASLLSQIEASILAQDPGTGRQIIGTSGNGRSTSFAIPNRNQAITFEDFSEMLELFAEVHETALDLLSLDEPDADDSTNNAAIFAKMMDDDRMQRVDSVHIDHTLGRWPSGAGVVP
jgi:hypothetical protein